jgi:hypothetical protein
MTAVSQNAQANGRAGQGRKAGGRFIERAGRGAERAVGRAGGRTGGEGGVLGTPLEHRARIGAASWERP